MRKISLALAVFWLSACVQAAPISLNSPDGEEQLYVDSVVNVTGKCGGAIVRVIGAVNEGDEFFGVDDDGTVVIIRRDAQSELRLRSQLSDNNKLDCVVGYNGSKQYLILATRCSGSVCPEIYRYTVVDPVALRIKTPPGGVLLERLKPYL